MAITTSAALLRGMSHHLSRTLDRVDKLNEKWTTLINRLEGQALTIEERIYREFPPIPPEEVPITRPKHFMEIAEQARRALNQINTFLEPSTIASSSDQTPSSDHTLSNQKPEQHKYVPAHQQIDQQVNQEFNQQSYIRLPELRLDPFSGDPRKWPTFWQLFSANIHQSPLSKVSKMSYLLTFLKGPAKDLVAGFILSNENYDQVLDLLQSRYGDTRAITEALEAELMNLQPTNESPKSLRTFVDTIETICRQLEAFGHVDTSPFISTVIKSRLPESILGKLIEKERSSGLRWNCVQLRGELRELVEIQEEVQRCTTLHQVTQELTTMPPHSTQPSDIASEETHELIHALGTHSPQIQKSNRPTRGSRSCSLCGNPGHSPSKCPEYSSPQDRKCRLEEQNRCLRCLREGHVALGCPSLIPCSQCQGSHHLLVCMNASLTLHGKTSKCQENHSQASVTIIILTPFSGG
uniref:CCHC-type domain-containing protein n=1 Tax=Meloidogyne incognita TaxID=6306 RepID=A0A914LZR0_MELIC